MGLSRSRLPIGEYGTVISLNAEVDNGFSELLKHDILSNVFTSNEIESKLLLILSIKNQDLILDYTLDTPSLLDVLGLVHDV